MSLSPVPVAAPDAAPDPTVAPDRQCGRCRQWFAGDAGPDGTAAGDWWACPPCHDSLFPNRAKRS
jgi:hypothetical protein